MKGAHAHHATVKSINAALVLAIAKKITSTKVEILVSGTSGFVGRALVPFLQKQGHTVKKLVRSKKNLQPDEIFWNPASEEVKKDDFENFDAIVHLAGKGIASGMWTKKIKQEIFASRARDTWLLSQILLRLQHPPKTFICASAIGIYGDRGNEVITEKSGLGEGFLSQVCKEWEKTTTPLSEKGIRVVNTRFGHVLGLSGGILHKILPLFKWGLGGKLGSGKQYISWIALEDLVSIIEFVLMHQELQGPVNVTSPNPVTMEEFTALVAKMVHRPAFFHLPAPLLHVIFGEMAKELFLSSTKVKPEKLLQSGYQFQYPELKQLLYP